MLASLSIDCSSIYLIFIGLAVILSAIIFFLLETRRIKTWLNVNPEDPDDRKKKNIFNKIALSLIAVVLMAVFLTPDNPSFPSLSRYNFLYAMCIEHQ